jgi:hypothetical protein
MKYEQKNRCCVNIKTIKILDICRKNLYFIIGWCRDLMIIIINCRNVTGRVIVITLKIIFFWNKWNNLLSQHPTTKVSYATHSQNARTKFIKKMIFMNIVFPEYDGYLSSIIFLPLIFQKLEVFCNIKRETISKLIKELMNFLKICVSV